MGQDHSTYKKQKSNWAVLAQLSENVAHGFQIRGWRINGSSARGQCVSELPLNLLDANVRQHWSYSVRSWPCEYTQYLNVSFVPLLKSRKESTYVGRRKYTSHYCQMGPLCGRWADSSLGSSKEISLSTRNSSCVCTGKLPSALVSSWGLQLLNARAILPLRIATVSLLGCCWRPPSHLPKGLSTRKSSQEEKKLNFETKKKKKSTR